MIRLVLLCLNAVLRRSSARADLGLIEPISRITPPSSLDYLDRTLKSPRLRAVLEEAKQGLTPTSRPGETAP